MNKKLDTKTIKNKAKKYSEKVEKYEDNLIEKIYNWAERYLSSKKNLNPKQKSKKPKN